MRETYCVAGFKKNVEVVYKPRKTDSKNVVRGRQQKLSSG